MGKCHARVASFAVFFLVILSSTSNRASSRDSEEGEQSESTETEDPQDPEQDASSSSEDEPFEIVWGKPAKIVSYGKLYGKNLLIFYAIRVVQKLEVEVLWVALSLALMTPTKPLWGLSSSFARLLKKVCPRSKRSLRQGKISLNFLDLGQKRYLI